MKCSTCGKKISFFTAMKSKHASGHFCSEACVLAASGSTEFYRGGILELICFCFYFPFWLGKIVLKMLKNKWVLTIFTAGLSWVAWKMLNAVYAPKKAEKKGKKHSDGDEEEDDED